MRRMYDAAFPPSSPPAWEAVAGYIGGNTPHVWTGAEWRSQPARWRLPIFTRSHGGDPSADAHTAVSWLTTHHVPKGACVALDYETRVDAGYLRAFDAAVVRAGWKVMVYGSKSYVLSNPKPSGGYWVADWTGSPFLYPGSAATQWASDAMLGRPWDANLVADSATLWDTKTSTSTGGDWFSMATRKDLETAVRKEVNAAIGLRDASETLLRTRFNPGSETLTELLGAYPDTGIRAVLAKLESIEARLTALEAAVVIPPGA
jgi:hypothetical protein